AVEALSRPLPVVEVRRRDGEAGNTWKRVLRRHVEDSYEAIGFVEGQRPQQHGVDDAEDGGVGADAEREDGDDGQRERRRPEQRSEAIAKVGEEGLHDRVSRGWSLVGRRRTLKGCEALDRTVRAGLHARVAFAG